MWLPEELPDKPTLLSKPGNLSAVLGGKYCMAFYQHLSCSIAFTSHYLNISHCLLVLSFLICFLINCLVKTATTKNIPYIISSVSDIREFTYGKIMDFLFSPPVMVSTSVTSEKKSQSFKVNPSSWEYTTKLISVCYCWFYK